MDLVPHHQRVVATARVRAAHVAATPDMAPEDHQSSSSKASSKPLSVPEAIMEWVAMAVTVSPSEKTDPSLGNMDQDIAKPSTFQVFSMLY